MKIEQWKRFGEKVLLKDLKKGDLFIETAYGAMNIYKMKEDPQESEPGCYEAIGVETTSGREVNFLQRDEYTHYGPDLYRYIGG